jgi:hypothetical protein
MGLGGTVLFFVLSFFARNTGGHQVRLNPLGSDPWAERELSEEEAPYNRNPKGHLRSFALKCLIFGVIAFVLDFFFG